VALITGASGGIGLELAKEFAAAGHDVVLVARSKDRLVPLASELEAAHGVAAWVIPADLAEPTAPAAIYEQVQRLGITVETLVNNAGFGTNGSFAETDLEAELAMLQVNVTALTHLTKLFLRDMLARGRGRIMNVGSTAGFQPGPYMAVYYATKAYVLSFSEALAAELQGSGVTVSVLCPGPTITGFQARARMDEARLMRTPWVMDAATVARLGYRGLIAGKVIVIPGIANRLLAFSTRLAPRAFVRQVTRRLNERSGQRQP
jgi:short-subunit dehydrogenase